METLPKTMKAAVFDGPNSILIVDKPIPRPSMGEALIRISTSSICEGDLVIAQSDHLAKRGITLGHEAIGTLAALGPNVSGYAIGERVLTAAMTPCGQCSYCLMNRRAHCGGRVLGGWTLGSAIDGSHAEYMIVPNAMANLASIPDELTDDDVIACTDTISTAFCGAEEGNVQIGDNVVIFAHGQIAQWAAAGAKLRGASRTIIVDTVENLCEMSVQLDQYSIRIDHPNLVSEIFRLTDHEGADVVIEGTRKQRAIEKGLELLKPGGTLARLGVGSSVFFVESAMKDVPTDHNIVTAVCPGGKERMRRLMKILLSGVTKIKPVITHRFKLAEIVDAYRLLESRRESAIKIAIYP